MRNFDTPFAPSNDLVIGDPGTLNLSLESFTITPAVIKPFEEAVMAWKVVSHGPNTPEVRINNLPVPAEGSLVLRPSASLKNVITGKHQGRFVKLGEAELQMDKRDCVESGLSNAENVLSGVLHQIFKTDPNILAIKTPEGEEIRPKVVIDEVGVNLEFRVKGNAPYIPDPTIRGHFHFRWGVVDSQIEPVFTKKSVKIRFPLHTYLLPASVIALPIIEGQVRSRVETSIENGLIQFASVFLRPPAGFDIFSVRTSTDLLGAFYTLSCEPATQQSENVGVKKELAY